MKKARKLGLQSLALVLMAFVLVAGVAFGMTGAWFQDKDNGSLPTITMGHPVKVRLYQNGAALESNTIVANRATRTYDDDESAKAMPGDTYTLAGDVTIETLGTTSNMYLFVKIVPSVASGFTVESGFLPAIADTGITEVREGKATTGLTYQVYKLAKKDEGSYSIKIMDATKSITIGDELTNAVAEQQIGYTVKVAAIQVANVNLADYNDQAIEALVQYNA